MKKAFKLAEVFTQAAEKLSNSHPERMRKDPANINKLACFFPLANDTQSFARQSTRNDNNVRSTVKDLLPSKKSSQVSVILNLFQDLDETLKQVQGDVRRKLGKLYAFTLAEVLITLGVIGVVAAITMPTLITNHKKKEVVTKLEKVYSVMNQAIRLAEAEYGDYDEWYLNCASSYDTTCTGEDVKEWYDKYLSKYISTTEIKTTTGGIRLYFADGSMLFINSYFYDTLFYLNKKALEKPKTGKNQFLFQFYSKYKFETDTNWSCMKNKKFEPYCWHWTDGTREGLFNGYSSYGCGDTRRYYCGKLIQYDGWQILDDYPVKL